MKFKKNNLLMSLCIYIIILSACSQKENGKNKKEEQIYNVTVSQEMPTADVSLSTDGVSAVVLNNIYEGLYRVNAAQIPEIAGAREEPIISEDGLTYVFKLREDAKWSDDRPVTAYDYVYGWQRTVDPATASEYSYLYNPILNAEDIIKGEKSVSELGIKALSEYELEITLTQLVPYFDYLLSFVSFMPQREDIVEKYAKDYTISSDKAVYNGPFVLVDFDGPGTDTEWAYERNEYYWDKDNVQLNRINVSVVKDPGTGLNLYEDNQVDEVLLSGELAQQMVNNDDLVIDNKASTSYLQMNYNNENSPFGNKNFRKALSKSIDRETLVNSIVSDGSIAATGWVPKNMSFNPESGADFSTDALSNDLYNKTEGIEAFNKAKEELKKDIFEVRLLSSDDDDTKKIMEFIQGQLEENLPGLTVSLITVPFSVRLDRSITGDFDLVYGTWGADYPDASSFLEVFTTNSQYNYGKYSNNEYDKFVENASTININNSMKRWNDMVNSEEIIMDDYGVIPIIQKSEARLRNKTVKDIVIHPTGAQFDYKWTYIEK